MDLWDENHICSSCTHLFCPDWKAHVDADHSDPSGLYSYRNQPSRILFALDKLVSAMAPIIGFEAEQGKVGIADGWSEGATKEDVSRWEAKMGEVMEGWDAEFWRLEREAERQGWLKVCLGYGNTR